MSSHEPPNRDGRVATVTYQEAGHTLEIGLEGSGVREYDYVGVDSAFAMWTVPRGAAISEDERRVIRRRIDEWAASKRLRLGFGPRGDLNEPVQRLTSSGFTVTEGADAAARRTLTVERPPVEGSTSTAPGVWARLRRWMGL